MGLIRGLKKFCESGYFSVLDPFFLGFLAFLCRGGGIVCRDWQSIRDPWLFGQCLYGFIFGRKVNDALPWSCGIGGAVAFHKRLAAAKGGGVAQMRLALMGMD